MKQKNRRRKKKRSPRSSESAPRAPAPAPDLAPAGEDESKALFGLMEAFGSISLEYASSAFTEAEGDVNRAAEILSGGEFGSDSCSGSGSGSSVTDSSSGSSFTDSSSGYSEGSLKGNSGISGKGFRGGNKQKRVVAAAGTVSTVLGKDYVSKAGRRGDGVKGKEFGRGALGREEAEQFLCSMLGDDCDIGMDLVRDVLCECKYDVEKALDALLELDPSFNCSRNDRYLKDIVDCEDDPIFLCRHSDYLTDRDRASDCTSHSSETGTDTHESIGGSGCRSYWQALLDTTRPNNSTSGGSNLPQKVLESLFNFPRSSEHERSSMNWRNVVKKMKSLGAGVDVHPDSGTTPQQDAYANGEEYHLFRKPATQHWQSMRSSYGKAAAAYSKGECEYASYLSDQGKLQTKLARAADEKASQDIFQARNKAIENLITIDLHGQHVKQAVRLLKLHLLFGSYVRSIQSLRVITGCGSHGVGKSKVKESVIKLLEKEGIKWREENRGTLLIRVEGCNEYSFLDSESDTE